MASDDYSEYLNAVVESTWNDVCKSDYAKVIFCDLYHNADSSVGCRFQITDNVHEDPCDYVGLFKIGYVDLSQCLVSKMLSETECEEDGKLLRCSFKTEELPELETGFYQFLYVTRDNEVCGASMAFEIRQPCSSKYSSDEDIVADKAEDDFLLVRSNLAEKKKHLLQLLEHMESKNKSLEEEMGKIIKNHKQLIEEKDKLLNELHEEKNRILAEYEKEKEANRVLTDEVKVKRKVLTELDRLLEDKNRMLAEHEKEKEETKRLIKANEAKVKSVEKFAAIAMRNELHSSDKLSESEKARCELEHEKCALLKAQKQSFKILTDQVQDLEKQLQQKNSEVLTQASELNDRSLLLSQLEDSQLMVKALEESKQLVITEMSILSDTIADLKDKMKEVKCENFTLQLKLGDSEAACEKLKESLKEVKCENFALKLQLSDSESANEQHMKHALNLQSEITALKLQFADSRYSQEVTNDCNLRPCVKKKEFKKKSLLKQQIKLLYADIREKDYHLSDKRQEIEKKNELIEFLTKEKDYIQKCNINLNEALDDALSRLNEAADIYKKQFKEIEKLKRKLKKKDIKSSVQEKPVSETQSVKDSSCSTTAETNDNVVNSTELSQNHSSDSDTGEHVVGSSTFQKENTPESVALINQGRSQTSEVSSTSNLPETCGVKSNSCDLDSEVLMFHPATSESAAFSPKSSARLSPELQTMIEQNLASLTSSPMSGKPGEEIMFSIPCPVCEQDIGIYLSSSDEMLKHLEIQHKQQICPVCGKLYDMTLPNKYFQYHVEDHFMNRNKV